MLASPEMGRLPHVALVPGLAAAVAALLLPLGACRSFRNAPAPVPLHTETFGTPKEGARCLVVFLPGIDDRAAAFATHGFPALLHDAAASCDAIGADAGIGYFRDRNVVPRLSEDVIGPARARGYSQVWLAGISLGGLAALMYAREHPEDVAGVVLLGPYLGDASFVRGVAQAGGAASWKRPPPVPGESFEPALWEWIGRLADPATPHPPLYLGYGTRDRFAPGQRLLAAVLPPENVFTVSGGHDWDAWRALWIAFLATRTLPGTR